MGICAGAARLRASRARRVEIALRAAPTGPREAEKRAPARGKAFSTWFSTLGPARAFIGCSPVRLDLSVCEPQTRTAGRPSARHITNDHYSRCQCRARAISSARPSAAPAQPDRIPPPPPHLAKNTAIRSIRSIRSLAPSPHLSHPSLLLVAVVGSWPSALRPSSRNAPAACRSRARLPGGKWRKRTHAIGDQPSLNQLPLLRFTPNRPTVREISPTRDPESTAAFRFSSHRESGRPV